MVASTGGERLGAKAEYDSRRPSSAEGKWSRGLGLFKYADPQAGGACLCTRGTVAAAGVRCAESPRFYFSLALEHLYLEWPPLAPHCPLSGQPRRDLTLEKLF